MLKVAIVTGSTRPGRNNDAVAQWVYGIAKARTDAEFEFVDIADFKLPLLDEPVPPSMGQYKHEHTKTWAKKIASFDGYVFVTPEYNHGISGALKNAIDYLYREWNNKAAGFVSYGSANGVRAVEHRCAPRWGSPCSTISRTSRHSSRASAASRSFRPCSTKSSLGARP